MYFHRLGAHVVWATERARTKTLKMDGVWAGTEPASTAVRFPRRSCPNTSPTVLPCCSGSRKYCTCSGTVRAGPVGAFAIVLSLPHCGGDAIVERATGFICPFSGFFSSRKHRRQQPSRRRVLTRTSRPKRQRERGRTHCICSGAKGHFVGGAGYLIWKPRQPCEPRVEARPFATTRRRCNHLLQTHTHARTPQPQPITAVPAPVDARLCDEATPQRLHCPARELSFLISTQQKRPCLHATCNQVRAWSAALLARRQ